MKIIFNLSLENYLGYTNVCNVISLLHFSYYYYYYYFFFFCLSVTLECYNVFFGLQNFMLEVFQVSYKIRMLKQAWLYVCNCKREIKCVRFTLIRIFSC